jgi:hypothetical protein
MIYIYINQAKKKAPRVNALKPCSSDAMRQTVGQILRLGLAAACDCRERERARGGGGGGESKRARERQKFGLVLETREKYSQVFFSWVTQSLRYRAPIFSHRESMC